MFGRRKAVFGQRIKKNIQKAFYESKHLSWGSKQMIGWLCWLINKRICQQMDWWSSGDLGSPIKTRDRFNCGNLRNTKYDSVCTMICYLCVCVQLFAKPPTAQFAMWQWLETNTFVNRLRDTRPDWAVNKRGRRDDRVSSQGRLRWLRRAFFGFGEGPMYPPYRPIWGNPHPRQAWA